MMAFLGLHFNPQKYGCKSIKMVYHSLHRFQKNFIVRELQKCVQSFGCNYLAAYGLLYHGKSKEPKITLSQLKTDLEMAKTAQLKEAVIFRLAGLNRSFAVLLKKYLS